jgi:hypothetical protein
MCSGNMIGFNCNKEQRSMQPVGDCPMEPWLTVMVAISLFWSEVVRCWLRTWWGSMWLSGC